MCGSYRAIKLLEQPVSVFGRVLEGDQMSDGDMRFGFMPGRGVTDDIFPMRQVWRSGEGI